jgi:hypothetical protein
MDQESIFSNINNQKNKILEFFKSGFKYKNQLKVGPLKYLFIFKIKSGTVKKNNFNFTTDYNKISMDI